MAKLQNFHIRCVSDRYLESLKTLNIILKNFEDNPCIYFTFFYKLSKDELNHLCENYSEKYVIYLESRNIHKESNFQFYPIRDSNRTAPKQSIEEMLNLLGVNP